MDWHARVRDAFAGSPHEPDGDVVEELAQHLAAMYQAARADGCAPDEAERHVTAQLALWRRDAAALRHRASRLAAVEPPPALPSPAFASAMHDVRYAARLLWRQPHFALLGILTMTLGIGLSAVLFSVTYGVLMKPLPWPAADRLVVLKETRGGLAPRFQSFTNAAYLAWREESSTLDELAAWSTGVATLTGAGDPDRIQITTGTASLFRVLGVRPTIGTVFDDADETTAVVVLSESLWRERLGASTEVVGRSISLDGRPYTIVGVVPDRQSFPDHRSRAWIPYEVRPTAGSSLSLFHAIAKLASGVTPMQAAAEGTARGRFVADTGLTTTAIFGGSGPVEVSATPLREALTGDVRRPLLVLLGAVVLLLAIATSNIAGLQLARATARRRELAIRVAIGASHARVLGQLVAESLLLGLAGCAAGLALAWLAHQALPAVLPPDFPRMTALSMDRTVMLVAIVTSIAASLAFGVLPALRLRRLDLAGALAEDGVSPTGISGRSGVAAARRLIVAGQVAIACVLLVGAVLLGRSFFGLLHADRGFDPSSVLSARLPMAGPDYTSEKRHAVVRQILSRLTAIPGVREAAVTSEHPLAPGGSSGGFVLPPRDAAGQPIAVQASPRLVSARYFAVLDLRLLAGRSFADTDTATSQPVVIVNDSFARRYLAETPVGTMLPGDFWNLGDRPEATVIGVVEDVTYVAAAEPSQPEMYFLLDQFGGRVAPSTATLLVRADGDPRRFASTLRDVVRKSDDALVADLVMTLEDRLRATTLVRPRLYAILLGAFAGLALMLTGVGLFAVLSYVFAQRMRELGVRAALGASQLHLVQLVLQQGLGLAVVGLSAGLLISLMAAQSLRTLLYGIRPDDLGTYLVVAAVLLAVAAVACIVPAYRAARLDPLRALRAS